MIRVVLLIEPITDGDPLREVESWDWYGMIRGDGPHPGEVEVESVEWVNR